MSDSERRPVLQRGGPLAEQAWRPIQRARRRHTLLWFLCWIPVIVAIGYVVEDDEGSPVGLQGTVLVLLAALLVIYGLTPMAQKRPGWRTREPASVVGTALVAPWCDDPGADWPAKFPFRAGRVGTWVILPDVTSVRFARQPNPTIRWSDVTTISVDRRRLRTVVVLSTGHPVEPSPEGDDQSAWLGPDRRLVLLTWSSTETLARRLEEAGAIANPASDATPLPGLPGFEPDGGG